jgi:signal transduction histidine kinase
MPVFLNNITLFSVALIMASACIFGFIVFFNDRKSITNRSFLMFCLVTVAWGIFNYLAYNAPDKNLALYFVRSVMFFATWQAFYFFQLFYVFPEKTFFLPKIYNYFLVPLVFLLSLFTLTPYIFSKVIFFAHGQAPVLERGPGLILFFILNVSFVILGLSILIKKIYKAKDEKRIPLLYILFGMFLTFSLILTFNFVLPVFYENVSFLPFSAFFTFPFIIFTSYAISKFNLLNIKVVSTEILVFILSVALVLDLLRTPNILDVLYNGVVFILVLGIGILLIRSVRKEIQQKEKTEKMAESLEKANLKLQELDKQKTEFLSIASHQLRTPLSILKGYMELITDGAYGKVNAKTKKVLGDMNESNERLVKLVDDFLDVSRIEQGRTKYVFEKKSMTKLIDGVVTELDLKAKDKGLKLEWKAPKADVVVCMDEEKMRHVVFNFVDNALKYSEKGTVKVSLGQENKGVAVRVKDQGFGFDKVDQANFFQKFYRGKNVVGTNVNGTGLGIFVAKKFVEKHSGKVWALSDGLGKGSEFGFWMPTTTSASCPKPVQE